MKASRKSFLKQFLGLFAITAALYELGFSLVNPDISQRVIIGLAALSVAFVGAVTSPWYHDARDREAGRFLLNDWLYKRQSSCVHGTSLKEKCEGCEADEKEQDHDPWNPLNEDISQ